MPTPAEHQGGGSGGPQRCPPAPSETTALLVRDMTFVLLCETRTRTSCAVRANHGFHPSLPRGYMRQVTSDKMALT